MLCWTPHLKVDCSSVLGPVKLPVLLQQVMLADECGKGVASLSHVVQQACGTVTQHEWRAGVRTDQQSAQRYETYKLHQASEKLLAEHMHACSHVC